MARKSRKKKGKLSARTNKRRRTASRPAPDRTCPPSTSSHSLPNRDSCASQIVRVDPDDKARQNDRIVRFQTACRFWEFGEFKRASVAFQELLELEHGDPHFSRYWLASCLFQLGTSEELDELLRDHDDSSGIWRFAQALHAFRLHGDTEDAQRILVEADYLEPLFEHYLLRGEVVDADREVRFDTGHAERAFGCARLFLPAWRGVPGAAAWALTSIALPSVGRTSAFAKSTTSRRMQVSPRGFEPLTFGSAVFLHH